MLRRTFLSLPAAAVAANRQAAIEIRGDEFWFGGKPTYAGRRYRGKKIQGLLMNSRMIQGIFDDENPETVHRWKYPDTGRWDAERNTREFIAAMPEWRRHGMLCFVAGLQGGSPEGYSKAQPWRNSAFAADGSLKPAYMARLEKILNRAVELGMVPMLNYFYFGQDEHLDGERAIRRAAEEATKWILGKGYRNVLVDVVNECDNRSYQQPALQAPNVHTLIELIKSIHLGGRRLLVSTSYNGGSIPRPNVVKASDFVLMHGNGVKDPLRIAEMVRLARQVEGYTPKPIMFNEDDHFDFDKPVNNMLQAVGEYASWGYFDPGKNDYSDGYQSPPVNWGLNNDRKRAFFGLVREMTGA